MHTAIPILRAASRALVLAALLSAAPAAAQTSARQRIDTAFTFDRTGSVHLALVSGEIRVTTGTTSEIRIIASIERGRLETTLTRTRVSIEARSVNGRMGSTRYEVVVPAGVRVRASAVSGEVVVRGTGGEVEASSVSGDVTIEDARGIVDVGSVSGDVQVTRADGRVDIESVSGDIDLHDVAGALSVETVSGEVTISEGRLTSLRAESVSGTISYRGAIAARGDYRMNSHSGDVFITVPANGGASLELETWSGDISSDFPLTLQPGENVGRRNRRMQFTVGSGGAHIIAETFSGDITIRRVSARNPE